MKRHIWKVFEFAGWFITVVAVIFGLLYASINAGSQMYGAGMLIVFGIILVLIGEYLIGEQEKSMYKMVWNALSMGGAFSLTIGIIWIIIQFLENYQSFFGIAVLLVIGVGMIVVGESIKFERK